MAELKSCPFCGGEDLQVINVYGEDYYVDCLTCTACGPSGDTYEEAIEAWNRRTKVEVNFYDKEETYPNCTVQVLTNTVTGDVSVGWWKNGGNEDA